MLTLDEFLKQARQNPWCSNAYVREHGFSELYVRLQPRTPAIRPYRLVEKLWSAGLPVYVECVHNQRFADKLRREGWTCVPHGPSFYKFPS